VIVPEKAHRRHSSPTRLTGNDTAFTVGAWKYISRPSRKPSFPKLRLTTESLLSNWSRTPLCASWKMLPASAPLGVQLGIEAANRGDFIEEEEMDARIEQMLQS